MVWGAARGGSAEGEEGESSCSRSCNSMESLEVEEVRLCCGELEM